MTEILIELPEYDFAEMQNPIHKNAKTGEWKEIVTHYLSENLKVNEIVQKMFNMSFSEYVANRLKIDTNYNINATHFTRSWNLRHNILARITPIQTDIKPIGLKIPKSLAIPKPLVMDFKAPNDNFNAFILAEMQKNVLTESEIIDALKLQNYTLEELKPYFKSLN